MLQAGNWYLYHELQDKYIISDMHISRSKIKTAVGIPKKTIDKLLTEIEDVPEQVESDGW